MTICHEKWYLTYPHIIIYIYISPAWHLISFHDMFLSKVLAFCDSQRRKKNLSTWDFVKLRILYLGSNECLHPGGRTSKWHHFCQFFRRKLMIHQSKGFQSQRLSDFEPTRNEALNLQCGAPKIAKLVYNYNNKGLWYLYVLISIVRWG